MHGNAPTQLRHASTARTTKATKRATCTWTPGRPPRLLHHLPVWSATDSAAQLLRKCLQLLHSARPLKRHRSNPSPPRGPPHAAHLLHLHAPATAKQQSQLQTTIAHPPQTRSKVFHSKSHTGAPQRAMSLLELAIHQSAATTIQLIALIALAFREALACEHRHAKSTADSHQHNCRFHYAKKHHETRPLPATPGTLPAPAPTTNCHCHCLKAGKSANARQMHVSMHMLLHNFATPAQLRPSMRPSVPYAQEHLDGT